MVLSDPSVSAHPLVNMLERHGEQLSGLTEQLDGIGFGGDGETDFIRDNFGFLADVVVEAGDYTIDAPDLLNVWAKVLDIFENRHLRYRFAAMVASGFAVQPLSEPAWKAFPRHYHEARELQEELREDQEGLAIARSRLATLPEQTTAARQQTGGVGVGFEIYENFGNGAGSLTVRLGRYANKGH